MTKTTNTWFKLPQLEDDEKKRQAAQLHTLLWLTLSITSTYTLVTTIITQEPFSPERLVNISFIFFLGFLLFGLRRGHIRLVSSLLVITLWISATLETWLAGGWHEATATTYIMVILLATLLLKEFAIIIFTLLTIIMVGLFAYLEESGILIEQHGHSDMITIAELILTISASVIFIYLIKNNLKQALHQAQQSNHHLLALRANLENQVAERTQAAEAARAAAEAAQQKIANQMWLTTGLARLGEVMRGEQDIPMLACHVIEQLCHHLEAPIGVLFIMEDGILSSVGQYGFASLAHDESSFTLGEGLVGEAALQGRMLTLTNLPSPYFNISSNPNMPSLCYLLLMPFLYNGQVIGLIELGNRHPFTETQQAFLQSITESVAIAFHTAQTRTHINTLISATQ